MYVINVHNQSSKFIFVKLSISLKKIFDHAIKFHLNTMDYVLKQVTTLSGISNLIQFYTIRNILYSYST